LAGSILNSEILLFCVLKGESRGVTLFRVQDGFPYLGYRVFPGTILANRLTILRFRRKVKQERARWQTNSVPFAHLKCFLFGCMGHLAQADSAHLRQKLCKEAWF
jgi:hypothetical protein